ncbi:hypothetical protein BC829DRAFT_419893 [Chytridium lagenaria]|nr:hypothetical protein BC829DRAFT_419893 [Chytridium lagenaria]
MASSEVVVTAWEKLLPSRYADNASYPAGNHKYLPSTAIPPRPSLSAGTGPIVHVQFITWKKPIGYSGEKWSNGIDVIQSTLKMAINPFLYVQAHSSPHLTGDSEFPLTYGTISQRAESPYLVSLRPYDKDLIRLYTIDPTQGPVKVSAAFPELKDIDMDPERFDILASSNHFQMNDDVFITIRGADTYGFDAETAAKAPSKRIYVHNVSDGSLRATLDIPKYRQIHLSRYHLLLFKEVNDADQFEITVLQLDDKLTPVVKDLVMTLPPRPDHAADADGSAFSLNGYFEVTPDGERIVYRRGLDLVVIDVVGGDTYRATVESKPVFGQMEVLVGFILSHGIIQD